MIKRLVVVVMSVALSADIAQAAINGVGDVTPPDPATWTSETNAYVGETGAGSLTVDDDSDALSYDATIGRYDGSTGDATVTGTGSTWTVAHHMAVGSSGDGTLDVFAGGAVSSERGSVGWYPGSTGVATVDGPGSSWTYAMWFLAGGMGDGTLNISNGGFVGTAPEDYAGSRSFVGHVAGAGAATVDGVGSTWTSEDIMVGVNTYGTLNITNGGLVNSSTAAIGRSYDEFGPDTGTGIVTVDGAGSLWASSSYLHVGCLDDGTLNITGGGAVSNAQGSIGCATGSMGAVTVSGAGSTWTNSDDLYVGYYGEGALAIANDGLVSVGDALTIDYDADGDAYVNMTTGGMLALYGDADDSLGSFLGLIDGTDTIRYWDYSATGWADIAGATYGDDYTLSYLTEGDLDGYTMLAVHPGHGPGNFDGDTDVDDTDIDLLGDAIRNGSTDSWLFDISADGTTGGADGVIDILDLDYLVRFLVETTVGSGTEYGDFNLDGLVDTTDLTRLATDYGSGDTWAKGNANRYIDLTTDVTDLTILSTYYGFGAPDAVPEPATLSLLAIGAAASLARRRR